MYAPGGFDATLEKWSTQGVYAKIKLMDHLPKKYRCIVFDRRECGQSGGRVERVTWTHYVAQGKGLLDHLDIERAHIMGGCMGCCPVAAFGAGASRDDAEHDPVLAGGRRQIPHQQPPAFRRASRLRAAARLGSGGCTGCRGRQVVRRRPPRRAVGLGHQARPRLRRALTPSKTSMRASSSLPAWRARLFDRDTAPGAEPEDLLRLDIPALIIPGRDAAHATSAARYLEECLPRSEYWDVAVAGQTEETAPARMLEFLERPVPRRRLVTFDRYATSACVPGANNSSAVTGLVMIPCVSACPMSSSITGDSARCRKGADRR